MSVEMTHNNYYINVVLSLEWVSELLKSLSLLLVYMPYFSSRD